MTNRTGRPLALILFDGWGFSSETEGNAVAKAHTPYYDELCSQFPSTYLSASGMTPDAAEVGHLHIGAGRIAETDVSKVATALKSGEFAENPILNEKIEAAARSGSAVHLVGLMSDAGNDSFLDTLYSLLRMAKKHGVKEVFVHGSLDGKDVPPRTADVYVEAVEIKMADIGIGRIASLCGRFFSMDEENNLERTARAYTMIVHGEGEHAPDGAEAVRGSFLRGISDEFIAPIVIVSDDGVPVGRVKENDVIIFFDHRPAGIRQLASFFSGGQTAGSVGTRPRFDVITLTDYGDDLGMTAAFTADAATNCLFDVLSVNGISRVMITDERRTTHLNRVLTCGTDQSQATSFTVPAPDPETIEFEPELKSFKITDKFLRSIEDTPDSVFVVNFPSAAILCETGDLERTIEAVQYLDTCLGGVLEKVREMNGVAIITASHGGCEKMGSSVSNSETHVPFHLFDAVPEYSADLRSDGSLIDVAPTMLGILGLSAPVEMTGRDLRQ